MPYFKWYGVDITTTYRSGKCFAPSISMLDQLLIKQEIALLRTKVVAMPPIGFRITRVDIAQVYSQLAVLLHSGVFLVDALFIVAQQASNPYMQELMYALAEQVHKGTSLSDACMTYPHYFPPIMIYSIRVGQETGTLATALELLSEHILMMHTFNKELTSAALMPAITFGFFVSIAITIIFGIMPRFVQMLSIKQADMPAITRFLMYISSQVHMMHIFLFIALLGFCWLLITWYYACVSGKYHIDRCTAHVPLIGSIVKEAASIYYLRSLALLTKSGMSLVPAMRIATYTIDNVYVRSLVIRMNKEVESGRLLSQAMMHESVLFGPDIQALVRVGEQSARLSDLLDHAADSVQKRVKQRLAVYVQVLQPLLLIIIGLLIAALIAATYIPLLTMSSSLGF